MQAFNARPAFCRLGGRIPNHSFQHGRTTRGFKQSNYNLQDDKTESLAPQRQTLVRRVGAPSQAANDVQQLYDLTQSRRRRAAPPVRRPPPDESGPPSESDYRKHRAPPVAVDLRSLGSAAQEGARPVLRPRSSHPANKASRTRTGHSAPAIGRSGASRRRSVTDRGAGGARTGRPGQRRGEVDEDEDPDTVVETRGEKTKGELAFERMEREDKEALEKPVDWVPRQETVEGLQAYLPRVPIGENGNTSLLTSRLRNASDPISIHPINRLRDLAARFRSGGYVYFRDEEEKAAVVAIAHQDAREAAEKKSERIGQVVEPILPEFEPLGKQSQAALDQELYKGKYPNPTESTQHGELDKIVHLIRKNSTYSRDDEASILKKLGELIQPPPAIPLQPTAKSKRKAKQAD